MSDPNKLKHYLKLETEKEAWLHTQFRLVNENAELKRCMDRLLQELEETRTMKEEEFVRHQAENAKLQEAAKRVLSPLTYVFRQIERQQADGVDSQGPLYIMDGEQMEAALLSAKAEYHKAAELLNSGEGKQNE